MIKFPCTQCGACCSSINGIDFLEVYNDNGRCTQLQNNRCTIYEKRPLLCNIDEAYDRAFSGLMNKNEFYYQNALACNQLQEKLGIDESYRVSIPDYIK
ncbi:YkgJ family cysteine cluster protein [Peribacillus frigoritolerans]|uniref:YkgJ family cysteine cluster protein n=1 Tax=Peribacillus frigoritolerans TaxID=450367 RepID=UPI003D2D7638